MSISNCLPVSIYILCIAIIDTYSLESCFSDLTMQFPRYFMIFSNMYTFSSFLAWFIAFIYL